MIQTNIIGVENVVRIVTTPNPKNVLFTGDDKGGQPHRCDGCIEIDGRKADCRRFGNVIGPRGSIVPLLVWA